VSKQISGWLETVVALGAGSACGLLIGFAIELSGHRWWAILMLLACVFGPSIFRASRRFQHQTRKVSSLSLLLKTAIVLLIIVATLVVEWAIGINPRDYGYVPLLPPVILAALLFGFPQGMLAVIVCTVIADYLFALPEYDFRITEMEDAVGLAVFAVLGAFFALIAQQFLPPVE
jgi:K+-sensing histidine kinase KdpD